MVSEVEGMKSYHILVIAAALLVLFGTYSVVRSFPDQHHDADEMIGVGPYYVVITVYGFAGLTLHVEYFLKSPGTVDVYVLTADEYVVFAHFMYPSGSLYAEMNRTAGSFTYTFGAMAPYYITFAHHAGITGDQQVMHLTVTASGVNALFLGGGVAMLSFAVVLVVMARRWRRASRRTLWTAPRTGGALLYGPRGPR